MGSKIKITNVLLSILVLVFPIFFILDVFVNTHVLSNSGVYKSYAAIFVLVLLPSSAKLYYITYRSNLSKYCSLAKRVKLYLVVLTLSSLFLGITIFKWIPFIIHLPLSNGTYSELIVTNKYPIHHSCNYGVKVSSDLGFGGCISKLQTELWEKLTIGQKVCSLGSRTFVGFKPSKLALGGCKANKTLKVDAKSSG